MNPRKPVPLAERVAASRARAIDSGSRPTPRGMLPPDAAAALDTLMQSGYAPSATACIARAIMDAAKQLQSSNRSGNRRRTSAT